MSILIRVWVYFGTKLLGDETMMAILFAQRVILEKQTFDSVPNTLKPLVYDELVLCGMEFLAEGYERP